MKRRGIRRRLTDQRGVIGILGVGMYSAIVVVIGAAMVTTSVINYRISNQRVGSVQSVYNAESGAEDALLQIKRNAAYGSTTTILTTTFNDSDRVETVVETAPAAGCGSAKQVTASGFVDDLVRRIQVSNCPTPSVDADFAYALQAGAGGILMQNNSTIYGSTYSNGNHSGQNNARVTGDAWVAGGGAVTASPQYDPANPTEFQFGKSSSPSVIDVAQGFLADTAQSNKLVKVSLKIRKVGNPSNATVRIVTDNNNKPSGSQVATGTLNASSVGSTLQFIDVSLSSPPTLTNGQRYWIVIDTASSSTNYWAWAAGADTGYTNGKGMTSSQWRSSGSMTWSDAAKDFVFKAFMGSPGTSLTGIDVNGDAHANTLNNVDIDGDAYFQTNNGSSIGGTAYPGSEDPPQRDLPITEANLIDFKNQAVAGSTYSGDYTVPLGQTRTLGPVKVAGNLNVSTNATLILTGTVWVTGSITFSNNAVIELDPGYGSTSGAIVGDGPVNIQNNVDFVGSGASNSYLLLATSGSPLNVANNADSIILAAPNGTIIFQNNAGANALAANRLELSNNATVDYLSGLADVQFSSGPGGTFSAGGWQEVVCDSESGPCEPAL
ncbi:MAG: hypothetical protein M3N59_01700 [bacterium]|nr:hypothetical protein [bacterium]